MAPLSESVGSTWMIVVVVHVSFRFRSFPRPPILLVRLDGLSGIRTCLPGTSFRQEPVNRGTGSKQRRSMLQLKQAALAEPQGPLPSSHQSSPLRNGQPP